jgi:WD repeat-containing protein 68
MDWYNKSKKNSITYPQSPGYPNISNSTNTGGLSPYSSQRMQYFSGNPSTNPILNNNYPQQLGKMATSLSPINTTGASNAATPNPMDRTSYFLSQYPLYCCDWTSIPNTDIETIALSTYNEGFTNKLQIIHGLGYGKEFTDDGEDLINEPMANSRSSRRLIDDTSSIVSGGISKSSVEGYDFHQEVEVNIDYPITNLQWDPAMISNAGSHCQRLAASSEVLRLYKLEPDYEGGNESVITQTHILANNTTDNTVTSSSISSSSGATNNHKDDINTYPPVTSFDWNKTDPNIIITSSVDTTCTVWDLHRSYNEYHMIDDTTNDRATVKTQLIAHDSEVFDVKFICDSTNIFASVGNDGSMRVFDLRSLEHSTIMYEPTLIPQTSTSSIQSPNILSSIPHSKALIKLSTSNIDQHHLATVGVNSNKVIIIDMRMPGLPVATLDGSLGGINPASINLIKWHPSSNYLLTGGDDCQALIWDCNKLHQSKIFSTTTPTTESGIYIDTPVLAYQDDLEVNNVCWRGVEGDWIGVVSGKGLQAVKL